MSETCQVCGKQITGIFSNWTEHIGKTSFWMSADYGRNMRTMGGKCGSCGKICCSDCYQNGACPSCNARLKHGGSLL